MSIKKIIKITARVLFIILTGFVLINQIDEELDPELTAILEKQYPVPPDNENAFFAYAGFYAEEGKDIVDEGRRILQEYAKSTLVNKSVMFASDENSSFDKLELKRDEIKICNEPVKRGFCLTQVRKSKAAIKQSVQDNRILIERYSSLFAFPHFYSNTSYLPETPFSTHNYVLKDIALQWIEGRRSKALTLLMEDIAFQRMLARESRIMIDKIVALAGLNQSLGLLHDFINECHRCVLSEKRTATVLAGLEEETLLSRQIMEGEIRWLYATYQNDMKATSDVSRFDAFNQLTDIEMLGEEPRSKLYGLLGYLLLPNATINDVFTIKQKPNLTLSNYKYQDYALQLETIKEQVNRNHYRWWEYLYNPGGKYLAQLGLSDSVYSRYIEAPFQTEAFLRLVRLQLLIKQRSVSTDKISAFLENQPLENFDPYTERPVQYDQENNSLYIHPFGREKEKLLVFL